MSLIKTPKEIKILREGGKILSKILALLASQVVPEISTGDLDKLALREIREAGASPAFLGYRNMPQGPAFPAALCTSINEEIVHSIPRKERVLKAGNIIGLDLGIKYHGLYTDAAISVAVGKISAQAQKLITATSDALWAGIAEVKPGNTIGDIGFAIESTAKAAGFSVVRDLVGHGVGHEVHEKPDVPNYGKKGTLEKLRIGMVLAIEPMLTTGSHHIKFLDDGWTVATLDGSLAAHFEHTVAVTEKGSRVLTE